MILKIKVIDSSRPVKAGSGFQFCFVLFLGHLQRGSFCSGANFQIVWERVSRQSTESAELTPGLKRDRQLVIFVFANRGITCWHMAQLWQVIVQTGLCESKVLAGWRVTVWQVRDVDADSPEENTEREREWDLFRQIAVLQIKWDCFLNVWFLLLECVCECE